jgi:hypothetical protein
MTAAQEFSIIVIHRGTQQIGGCVTEIAAEDSRVFIDFGENLSEDDAAVKLGDGEKFDLPI